jgi:hypothetical protein
MADTARFDWNSDEDGFFETVLHMESEGAGGGTDESRARLMQKYGIRDRSHWQDVKQAVYQSLTGKYGSFEEVSQREMNFRMGQVERQMQANVAAQTAGGGMAPVEGVTLEAWAAINAAIVSGANLDDLLKGSGIERARWDRAKGEWEGRMARDTTFAIAQVYGAAFQNASKGKYGEHAREANAARTENRELRMQPPVSLEEYWEILYEQAYAAKQGRDPGQALKAMGLSIVDWTDLSTFMGYHLMRTWAANQKSYQDTMKHVEGKLATKYPGVKADVSVAY